LTAFYRTRTGQWPKWDTSSVGRIPGTDVVAVRIQDDYEALAEVRDDLIATGAQVTQITRTPPGFFNECDFFVTAIPAKPW
jgi:hypothetical protein